MGSVLFIDYGNRMTLPKANCASLPSSFTALTGFAKEYQLALCKLATDEEYASQGREALREDLLNRQLNMNVEYRVTGLPFVSFTDPETKADIGKNLIQDGLMMLDRKGGRRMNKLITAYQEAQDKAKKEHLNIWEYGDITEDDAKEFGR